MYVFKIDIKKPSTLKPKCNPFHGDDDSKRVHGVVSQSSEPDIVSITYPNFRFFISACDNNMNKEFLPR